ncbi:MAG: hypothetical protein L3J89_14820 [Gammaproteobacteria bacterium]|nr:hypothetical protein [Gammaproteobacteria bacterium]
MAQTIICRYAIGIISAVLLTACAQLPLPADSSPQAPLESSCGNVLEFYTAVSRLSDLSQEEVLQALRADVVENNEACSQLRLALMLRRPGMAYQDDEAALNLLAIILHDFIESQHPARSLALLLVEEIDERNRLRATGHALQQRLKQGRSTAAVLRRQLEALRSQLEQLKSIEQDINEKERASVGANLNPETDREPHEPK